MTINEITQTGALRGLSAAVAPAQGGWIAVWAVR
jgi:hypothetical protein